MGLRDLLASWLSGARDASLEPHQHVEQLRTAFGAAEREHTEATRRRDDAAAVLAAAEQAYDSDASDENGTRVLHARGARDLAALRADRAGKRQEEARVALAGAEQELARARLVQARAAAEKRAPELRMAVDSARATVARSNPAAELVQVVQTFERAELEPRAELASVAAELEALPGELERLEAELVTLAPELADELAAARAGRAQEARAELARRASLEAFRETIAGDLATFAAAAEIADRYKARTLAALTAQRSAAVEASKLGLEAKPLADQILAVHVAHARYMAKPPAERDAKAHAAELWNTLLPENRYHPSGVGHVSHEEVTELCLRARSGAELVVAAERLSRDRAFAAGDVNEINRRRREAQARPGPSPSVLYGDEIDRDYARARPMN